MTDKIKLIHYADYEEELREVRRTNEFELGEAALSYPNDLEKVSQLWVEAVHKKDVIKRILLEVRASAELYIRRHIDEYDVKPTEASIKALVEEDEEVVEYEELFIQATKEGNHFAVAKKAMEDKKGLLEHAIRMYMSGYWSDMPVPDTTGHVDEKLREKLNEGLSNNERMQRRMKDGK